MHPRLISSMIIWNNFKKYTAYRWIGFRLFRTVQTITNLQFLCRLRKKKKKKRFNPSRLAVSFLFFFCMHNIELRRIKGFIDRFFFFNRIGEYFPINRIIDFIGHWFAPMFSLGLFMIKAILAVEGESLWSNYFSPLCYFFFFFLGGVERDLTKETF